MDQSIYISIQKLSTPVEELGLGKRIYRWLRRAGLYTVADILLTGKPSLHLARNIGPRLADYIWMAVASYLNLPEDQLTGAAPLLEENQLAALDAPIAVLHLPLPTISALESMGLFRIRELIKGSSTAYNKFLGMSVKEIGEIDRTLQLYFAQAAHNQLPESVRQAAISGSPAPESQTISVPDLSLPLPKINEFDWSMLEYQSMHLSTLEQTGANFGLNKAKLRRTIERAHMQLQQKMVFLSLFLDHFERKSGALSKELGNGPLDLKTMGLHLLSDPKPPDLVLEAKKVEKLIILIRSMVLQSSPWFKEQMEPRWPSFIMISCLAEPPIAKYAQVRQILRTRNQGRKITPNWELAYSVLAQAGKPMHFSAIAEGARQLDSRFSLSAKGMHQTLITHKKFFVRVGPGEYALAEWEVQTADFYPAIIACVLREANRPMSLDWIHARVSAIRPITQSSLRMIMSLHFRFYRSIQDTYGLRGWLPVGESKDLLFPDWLVETSSSFKRVERARAKGYHVQRFFSEDRLCQDIEIKG